MMIRMSEPLTKVQKVDSTTTAKSYNFAYKYEDPFVFFIRPILIVAVFHASKHLSA